MLSKLTELQNSFFDLSLDMLCIAGTDGFLKKVNQRWTETLGWTEAELTSQLMTNFIHPDDVLNTINVRENFNKNQHIFFFQNRYRCKDGTYKKFEWTARREAEFVIGVAREITERVHSDEYLKQMEDSAHIGGWRYFFRDNKLVYTRKTYEICGLPFGSRVDLESALNMYDSPFREVAAQAVEECVSTGKIFDIELCKRDGCWTRAKGFPHFEAGKIEYVFGTFQDVTEVKLLELERERSQKINYHKERLATIGELAAGVGHEINNPLMIANGQIERIFKKMAEEGQLDDKYLEYKNKYLKASERIAKVVSGLKQFSTKEGIDKAPVEINSVVESTLELVSEIFEKTKIKIHFTPTLKAEYVFGHQTKLQQVIMNLLLNSKDALVDRANKLIEIKIVNDGQIRMTVTDSGAGVPSEIEDKIFNPFFTTKPPAKGSGIGLALCRNLIKEHEGEIRYVRTENGACFEVLLPVELNAPEIQTDAEMPKSQPFPVGAQMQILVVDDELDIGDFLKSTLESASVAVDVILDGIEALEKLKTKNYDVIITDQNMPSMDGKTLIKNIFEQKLKSINAQYLILTGAVDSLFSEQEKTLAYFKKCKVLAKSSNLELLISQIKESLVN